VVCGTQGGNSYQGIYVVICCGVWVAQTMSCWLDVYVARYKMLVAQVGNSYQSAKPCWRRKFWAKKSPAEAGLISYGMKLIFNFKTL
jgi:hypothetical protein